MLSKNQPADVSQDKHQQNSRGVHCLGWLPVIGNQARGDSVEDCQNRVVKTPKHKIPGGAMPQPGKKEDDEEIPELLRV